MSQNKFINIMISSRNNCKFDNAQLSELRKELKQKIEDEKIFGRNCFKVWINEDEDPQGFDTTIWNKCLKEARQADIIIVLFNGQSGWLKEHDKIGICHAELLEALNAGSGKVWGIELKNCTYQQTISKEQEEADTRFKKFVNESFQLFSKPVSNKNDLFKTAKQALNDAVIKLMERGVIEVSRNKDIYGEVLTWKRKNYTERSDAILDALKNAIDKKGTGTAQGSNYFLTREDLKILLILHAIPDSVSIASARERVGQPFLLDFKSHKLLSTDDSIIGPVHVIGCNKSITETQARNILGFPDAIILKDSFGIYVADSIQKIQMVFLEKCSDSYSTTHAFQEFIDWMIRMGEMLELEKRAISRKNIILSIASEN